MAFPEWLILVCDLLSAKVSMARNPRSVRHASSIPTPSKPKRHIYGRRSSCVMLSTTMFFAAICVNRPCDASAGEVAASPGDPPGNGSGGEVADEGGGFVSRVPSAVGVRTMTAQERQEAADSKRKQGSTGTAGADETETPHRRSLRIAASKPPSAVLRLAVALDVPAAISLPSKALTMLTGRASRSLGRGNSQQWRPGSRTL